MLNDYIVIQALLLHTGLHLLCAQYNALMLLILSDDPVPDISNPNIMCNPGFIGFIVIDTFSTFIFLLHDTRCGALPLFFEDYPQCTHKYDPGVTC